MKREQRMNPDPIALADQAMSEVRQSARVVAAYYKQLREEGIEEWEGTKLALAFQRRLIFPQAIPGIDDSDDTDAD